VWHYLLSSEPSNDPLFQWLSNAGSLGILASAVVGFLRGWIVSGTAHRRVLAERDRAMELVYKQAELTARALRVTERGADVEDARRREE
jgi:hypothetical protein